MRKVLTASIGSMVEIQVRLGDVDSSIPEDLEEMILQLNLLMDGVLVSLVMGVVGGVAWISTVRAI